MLVLVAEVKLPFQAFCFVSRNVFQPASLTPKAVEAEVPDFVNQSELSLAQSDVYLIQTGSVSSGY